MVWHYLIVAVRNLARHPGHSLINIVGLGVGMGCCVLMATFIRDELTLDSHHKNKDRVYRVLRETRSENAGSKIGPGTSGPLAPALESAFPEIEAVARLWADDAWIRHGDRGFDRSFGLVDPSLPQILSMPLLAGDASAALSQPSSALISESFARDLFGDTDPIGQTIEVDAVFFDGEYRIAGVMKTPPVNTSFDLDVVTSTVKTFVAKDTWHVWKDISPWRPIQTFILLHEGQSAQDLTPKLQSLLGQHMGPEIAANNAYHLQPLPRMHLYSMADYGMWSWGDIDRLYLMGTIGLCVLVLVSMNFINLTTARASRRLREIGMRKAVGARPMQVARQFLGEAILQALAGFVVAVAVALLARPHFSELLQRPETDLGFAWIVALCAACVLATGVLAGMYPAVLLSRLQPVLSLKGRESAEVSTPRLRRLLVLFQVGVAVSLIFSALTIRQQLDYVQSQDLGFDTDQLISLPIFWRDQGLSKRYQEVKQRFLRHPSILEAAASMNVATTWDSGLRIVRGEGVDQELSMNPLRMDEDFLPTLRIPILAGRGFTESSHERAEFILNESAVRLLGWEDPIGKRFSALTVDGVVVGVIKDFHYQSLHSPIGPAFAAHTPWSLNNLVLRIAPGDLEGTVEFLRRTWDDYIPNHPLEWAFMDQRIARFYRGEARLGRIVDLFALIAIAVSSLGLVALASFSVQRRSKEIGVRKVLGATVLNVFRLLLTEYLILSGVASLIALPVIAYVLDGWLDGFASRIQIDARLLAATFGCLFLLTLASVGYHTGRSSLVTPVDLLGDE